jgi:GGDEF domain-containing protein
MIQQRTAGIWRVTERQKARARLILLTLVGLVCPPLAGARSPAIWVLYLVLAVIYSLWALRLTRHFSGDRRLGYLLCLTDGAILLPLLAWNSTAAMRVLLVLLWAAGLLTTWVASRASARTTVRSVAGRELSDPRTTRQRGGLDTAEALLERALRVRLRVLGSTKTRFALVLLRVLRFDEIATYYGTETAKRVLTSVGHRGLRLLGPDAQVFLLDGGRVAFVFATDAGATGADTAQEGPLGWIDPYDVESLAMSLARRACEHLVDGQKVECVVGWASAPADGVSAEDLMYAAESGAQSTAAFRRVAGSAVPVPEKSRAAAG